MSRVMSKYRVMSSIGWTGEARTWASLSNDCYRAPGPGFSALGITVGLKVLESPAGSARL